jgi:hypothetical protein
VQAQALAEKFILIEGRSIVDVEVETKKTLALDSFISIGDENYCAAPFIFYYY